MVSLKHVLRHPRSQSFCQALLDRLVCVVVLSECSLRAWGHSSVAFHVLVEGASDECALPVMCSCMPGPLPPDFHAVLQHHHMRWLFTAAGLEALDLSLCGIMTQLWLGLRNALALRPCHSMM
jgi:hypothetical protein